MPAAELTKAPGRAPQAGQGDAACASPLPLWSEADSLSQLLPPTDRCRWLECPTCPRIEDLGLDVIIDLHQGPDVIERVLGIVVDLPNCAIHAQRVSHGGTSL